MIQKKFCQICLKGQVTVYDCPSGHFYCDYCIDMIQFGLYNGHKQCNYCLNQSQVLNYSISQKCHNLMKFNSQSIRVRRSSEHRTLPTLPIQTKQHDCDVCHSNNKVYKNKNSLFYLCQSCLYKQKGNQSTNNTSLANSAIKQELPPIAINSQFKTLSRCPIIQPKTKHVEQSFYDPEQILESKPVLFTPALGFLDSDVINSNIKDIVSSADFEETHFDNLTFAREFLMKYDHLKAKNVVYIDHSFPPTQQSLGNYNYQWKTINQLFQGIQRFFAKDEGTNRFGVGKWIGPSDILQGNLNNCYLLACISALGNKRPEMLLDLFITRRINNIGIYGIKLCVDGVWQVIDIDDYFPASLGQPAFAYSRNNAIWVMIIEKAWSKLCGSYSNSNFGIISEIFRTITAAPTYILYTNASTFLTTIRELLKLNVIMVAASYDNHQSQIVGLVPNHAYSILKIKEIEHPELGKLDLVKLRNPWGKGEWKGDWSIASETWTEELRQKLKVDQELDNGVFYVEMNQFRQYFQDITVCMVKMGYQYEYMAITSSSNHSTYTQFQIAVAGQYYLSVMQPNKRFPKSPKKYSKASILIIKKLSNDKYQYLNGNTLTQNELWISFEFTPGIYLVVTKVRWSGQRINSYALSSYGPDLVKFQKIDKINNLKQMAFLRNGMKQQKTKLSEQINACYDFGLGGSYGYYFIENIGVKQARILINFIRYSGLKLCKPQQGTSIQCVLKPNKVFIAIFKISEKGYIFETSNLVQFYD